MSATNFSGLLSAFTHSFNTQDIMSHINYINANPGSDYTGQIAVIVAGGLVFGWSNANSWVTLTKRHSYYGNNYYYGTAIFPLQTTSFICSALTTSPGNTLTSIECTSSTGTLTVTINSPNATNSSSTSKFFFIGVGITSWVPSPSTPTFSGYLSHFNGSNLLDIIEGVKQVNYTSVTGGDPPTGLVATAKIGNFRIAFNNNGYVSFGAVSNTLTITLPLTFTSSNVLCFCSSFYPNVLPYAGTVTVNPLSVTFTLSYQNYYAGYMATNFILLGL